MSKHDIVGISHFGVCVSDLDRSLHFYRDGLGFVEGSSVELENQCGNVMGLENFALMARFLSLGTVSIELLWYRYSENASRAAALRPMNHTGLTHLALSVKSVDEVARTIEEHGGKIFPETRALLPTADGTIELLYCSDPDHTRIELIRYPS